MDKSFVIMKKILVVLFSIVSLISCQDSDKEKKAILSESNGKINNISIFLDENLWNGEIGDSIRKKGSAATTPLGSDGETAKSPPPDIPKARDGRRPCSKGITDVAATVMLMPS